MTCSWSSLVCILVSSSKPEMSNTSWALISCPVLLFPCCRTILPAEKLDTTTENRENPNTQTLTKAESSLHCLCPELFQHVCKYCSGVLKGQGSPITEVPRDNVAQSVFLLLCAAELTLPFLCKDREAIYNYCSPGCNWWDLTLPEDNQQGLTVPCWWPLARNNPAWGILKKKKAQSQLLSLHKTRGGWLQGVLQ